MKQVNHLKGHIEYKGWFEKGSLTFGAEVERVTGLGPSEVAAMIGITRQNWFEGKKYKRIPVWLFTKLELLPGMNREVLTKIFWDVLDNCHAGVKRKKKESLKTPLAK